MNEWWLKEWVKYRLASFIANVKAGGDSLYLALADSSCMGEASTISSSGIEDAIQNWFPFQYAARAGGRQFLLLFISGDARGKYYPIINNTATSISLVGDPEADGAVPRDFYVVVHPDWVNNALPWWKTANIKAVLGYVLDPAVLPCVSVVRAAQQETQQFIGGRREVLEVSGGQREAWGSLWTGQWSMMIWADNPEISYWVQRALEWYYIQDVNMISRLFVGGVSATSGDLEPQPDWFPARVFARTITLSGEVERFSLTEQAYDKITDIELNPNYTQADFGL